jgi:aerobic carbon-monoxide dehydrogenase large subunit
MDDLIGQPLARVEDERLLTGRGRFIDDLNLPDQAYAVFVRSPHAHARLGAIDTAAAADAPGVLAVLTGRDYVADGLGGLSHAPNSGDHLDPTKPAFGPGTLPREPLPLMMPLAVERVRHVGEMVVMVVAGSEAQARDAAELVAVRYEALPAIIDVEDALKPGAPVLWEGWADNCFVVHENGDRAALGAAMKRAAKIVRFTARNQRVCPMPLEPRGAIGAYDPASEGYTLHSASQGVHRHKNGLLGVLRVPPAKVRVVTGDVGGGFGVRSPCYPEYPLLLWAARRIGRAVKWSATRAETFLSDFQARELLAEASLALDAAGRFLALGIDYVGNLGSHPASFAVLANLLRMAGGVYDIPALHVRVRGVTTNTLPVGVYRGAGRPEATFVLERLIDMAAAEMGIDRAALRRRNLIATLPYQSPLGHRYDCGAFAENFSRALRLADWDGFAARRDAAAARGKRLGIGVANYLESPTGMHLERTDVRVREEGRVTAVIGTQASGQGHETSFAQVVATRLGVPFESVAILFGDSDVAVTGGGSHSDRSMRLAGTILLEASDEILLRARRLAAHALEAAEADIVQEEGRFTVAGTDRAIGLFALARVALLPSTPEELRGPLAATSEISRRLHAHPTGAAACEVEIDPDTGAVRLTRYVTVDDVGRIINPLIVEGQVHGGIAQSVGQALMEDCVYDGASAQLLAGSFMDYAMPRADDLPLFATETNTTLAESNPLGIKGAGECGTTPATAAIINSIADALDLRHIEMPASPERVWRAMRR